MTVEEVKSEIVMPALARAQGAGHVVLVASRGKEILGTLTMSQGDHQLTKHRVSVGGFVIASGARGTGLARRLVDEAARRAKAWGATMLEISCRGGTRAEGAYGELGFVEWGRLPGGLIEEDGNALMRSIPIVRSNRLTRQLRTCETGRRRRRECRTRPASRLSG